MRVTRVRIVLAAALAAISPAAAQEFPDAKPIHLIVPAAPGGITDIMARLMAGHVGQALNQRMVEENKPAGGGNAGIGSVAQGAPAGYTLLLANVGQIACNPRLYRDVPFDTMSELVGVGPVGAGPGIVMVNATMAEPPADFDARIRRDYEKYGEIISRTAMRDE